MENTEKINDYTEDILLTLIAEILVTYTFNQFADEQESSEISPLQCGRTEQLQH